MTIKVTDTNFKKCPLNFQTPKNVTVTNNETARKSVQLETDNSVFSAKSEIIVLEPSFPANSTIYVDEDGLIQNSEGAFYTTDQGYGCIGYTNSEGKLTIDPIPHDFIEVLGMDTASGLLNVKYHDQNINII